MFLIGFFKNRIMNFFVKIYIKWLEEEIRVVIVKNLYS